MFQEEFSARLTALRQNKGVSARDMSLSIGQNAGYINSIESGKSLPSMSSFLFICDYLNITPLEFFDLEVQQPQKLRRLTEQLKKLDDHYLDHIIAIVDGLVNNA